MNPFSYVGNNPTNTTDPGGQCYGPLEFLRKVPIEKDICTALDQAMFIYAWPGSSASQRNLAAAYIGGWAFAHSALIVGVAGLAVAGGQALFSWLYGIYLAFPFASQITYGCEWIRQQIASLRLPSGGGTTTVLGHYPGNKDFAVRIGAKFLDIPQEVWNRLSEASRWAINRLFLDLAIARGDRIVLSTPLSEVRPGSYLEREIAYLFSLGYQFIEGVLVKVR